MKDKVDLLTFYDEKKGNTKKANKLRFIFSHSSLKEGWDNPNVFQVCTLIETKDTISKRQKIGRGLRIAVNQDGERVPGFEVNNLTVMANESYNDFAQGLQKEYEDEGVKFGIFDDNIFSSLVIDEDEDGIKTPLGTKYSKEIVSFLVEEEYIDIHHKGTEKLAEAIKENTFTLPEEIETIATQMREKVVEIIQNKFNAEKVEIKDRKKRVPVKLNKHALSGPFLDLWSRIQNKTTYSINFDSEEFIRLVAEKLSTELEIKLSKFDYNVARLQTGEDGISAIEEQSTQYTSVDKQYEEVPDILSYLQNETNLTRKTIIGILKRSGTLKDFKRNPQEYMMSVARIINSNKRLMMVEGVKYEKIDDTYDQSLLTEGEIDQYSDNTIEVKDDRYPYNYVVFDSTVERDFALECEKDSNVRYYIKLPSQFKIDTPLGGYNPDWAILLEESGQDKLYFVIETKGSTDSNQLRPTELAKIKCGRKHFDAIDTGVSFKVSTSLKQVY